MHGWESRQNAERLDAEKDELESANQELKLNKGRLMANDHENGRLQSEAQTLRAAISKGTKVIHNFWVLCLPVTAP